MYKVGIFDSGIGGLSVAEAVKKYIPNAEVISISDQANMPYGDKPPKQVFELVLPQLQQLVNDGCEAIVIACNTVTTNHIEDLRRRIAVPLVGIEPMVRPASLATKTGVIAVCATPATLRSARYAWLKQTYAKNIKVIEPDCSKWAYMIEHSKVNKEFIRRQINNVCNKNADVIVLGCTHYHWIEDLIKNMVSDRVAVIQPEQAVVAQLKRVLSRQQ